MSTGSSTERQRVSYPVANLRAEVSGLETAIAQVMARPRKEAVHRVRTMTRKIEAQLEVVAELARQVAGFKAVERESARVRKLLRQVRRAAAKVRDLDVQRKLTREVAGDRPAKKVRDEAKDLRAQLKAEREAEAEVLRELLKGHGLKLEPRLELLLEALEPVAGVGMSPVELEVVTRGWYKREVGKAARKTKTSQRMHGVRKAAKIAKYMAESGLAARVVQEFGALQEAGGQWHDRLNLRDTARKRLGRRSGLVDLAATQEESAKSSFAALIDGQRNAAGV